MGTDSAPKRLTAHSVWRWFILPQFSALHISVFGGIILLIYDWRFHILCQCVSKQVAKQKGEQPPFLGLPHASQQHSSAEHPRRQQELEQQLECKRATLQSREMNKEMVLPPQKGIEEPEEARGTNMILKSEMNTWGIPMANSTLFINGKTLTFDDILYGYDLMFENLAMFSRTSWFGVSTQQDPADAFALSSLLWREQPDLLIEIGTNTGGGAIFYATIMREYNPNSLVLTIDPKDPATDWARANKGCPECVDVRCSNIWHTNVEFVKGLSSDAHVLERVKELTQKHRKTIVMHDGSHFYQDVLGDLKAYDSFTSVGSYMVVQDTKMTRMYKPLNGDGFPLEAARDFMLGQGKDRYVVDKQYEFLLYSQHHNGFLRKLKS